MSVPISRELIRSLESACEDADTTLAKLICGDRPESPASGEAYQNELSRVSAYLRRSRDSGRISSKNRREIAQCLYEACQEGTRVAIALQRNMPNGVPQTELELEGEKALGVLPEDAATIESLRFGFAVKESRSAKDESCWLYETIDWREEVKVNQLLFPSTQVAVGIALRASVITCHGMRFEMLFVRLTRRLATIVAMDTDGVAWTAAMTSYDSDLKAMFGTWQGSNPNNAHVSLRLVFSRRDLRQEAIDEARRSAAAGNLTDCEVEESARFPQDFVDALQTIPTPRYPTPSRFWIAERDRRLF